ncbi:hypothetical protein BADSM9389_30670 [Buttiauxella agrestis]|nr:hypothetical protein BADSM9389_30670 [Buttiauxella agrestis]
MLAAEIKCYQSLYHVFGLNKWLASLDIIKDIFSNAKYIEMSWALMSARIFLILFWTK